MLVSLSQDLSIRDTRRPLISDSAVQWTKDVLAGIALVIFMASAFVLAIAARALIAG